jgi:hypothetical protein
MSPINPTIRRSLRAPKLKEIEVGEGSSPGIAKQLEYTPRPEPIIKTKMEKVFIQPQAFGDTEESTGSKLVLPHLGDIFNNISREEYSEYIPHSDTYVRFLDNQVFPNI